MHWRKRKKLRRIAQHHGFTHWHQYNKFMKIINITNSIWRKRKMIKLALLAMDAVDVPREMLPAIIDDVNIVKEATDYWNHTHEICEKMGKEIEKEVYGPVANLALHLIKQTIQCINKEDIPVQQATWSEQDTKDMARSIMRGLFTPYLVKEGETPDNIIDSMTDDQVLELAEAVASGMQESLESRNTNDSINIKI